MDKQFMKLLNLAMEMEENQLTDIQDIKDILIREELLFEERSTELRINYNNHIIPLISEKVDTKVIWNALDENIDLKKNAIS